MSGNNLSTGNAAREEILRRIRAATENSRLGPSSEHALMPRPYRVASDEPRDRIIAQFAERVAEYRATVHRIASTDLPAAIAGACAAREVRRLVAPEGIPAAWLPAGVEVLRDRPEQRLRNEQLDTSDGVLTGCALGIAQTGTVVLDGGATSGRRVLSLLPDYHLCIVFEHQVVGQVPEAIRSLEATVRQMGRPLTFVSGPSATSDIELNRVEGVHGPRTLEVLLVHGATEE